jgi:hypothetical protein
MNGEKLEHRKPGDRTISLLNQARRGSLSQGRLPLTDFCELCIATDAGADEARKQECYSVIQSWRDGGFVELEEEPRGEVVVNPGFLSVVRRAAEGPQDWVQVLRGDVPKPAPKIDALRFQTRMDLYISHSQAKRIVDRLTAAGYLAEGVCLWLGETLPAVRAQGAKVQEAGPVDDEDDRLFKRKDLPERYEFVDTVSGMARDFKETFRKLQEVGGLEKRGRNGYRPSEIRAALAATEGLERIVFRKRTERGSALNPSGSFGGWQR